MATFDTATPVGGDVPAVVDDRIREVKAAVQERENVDHYWPLSGTQVSDANAGKHRRVLFYGPLAAEPSVAAGEACLYTYDVGGVPELLWKDDEGNVIQLTSGGALNILPTLAVLLSGDQTIAGVKTFSDAILLNGGFGVGQNTDIGNYQLRARQFYADVATGTAPLLVASTTKVANLNADQVDGLSLAKYDSGWFAVSTNTTYSKAHGLGAVPTFINVLYSDTADGSGDVVGVGTSTQGGDNSTMICDVDDTYIKLRCPYYIADYQDAGGVHRIPRSGYLKVTALLVQ